LSKELPAILINTIRIFISGSINFLVGIVIAFYISIDFTSAKKHLLELIPERNKRDYIILFRKLDTNLKDFVFGTLVTSLLVALCSLVGFLIAGLNAPVLFALFCGITNIIPYFGPYIGGIPAVIVAFSISPIAGVITLVTIIIVQFIEGNFIHPLVMSKAINLHPITIVISLLIFEHFFGIMGMVIATPLISTGKIVFEFFSKKYNLMKIFNR
jgi:predicted PurR-regulated permease PerM